MKDIAGLYQSGLHINCTVHNNHCHHLSCVLNENMFTLCTLHMATSTPIPPHTHTSYLSLYADLITHVEVSCREGYTPSTSVSVLVQSKLVSSSLTFYLSRSFFCYRHPKVQCYISNVWLLCLSPSYLSCYSSSHLPPCPSIPRWPYFPIPTIGQARAPINPTSFVLPLPSTLGGIYDSTLNANGV